MPHSSILRREVWSSRSEYSVRACTEIAGCLRCWALLTLLGPGSTAGICCFALDGCIPGFLCSVCSPEELDEVFGEGRMSPEDIAQRGDELLSDPELCVRMGGCVMPWRQAQPYIADGLFSGSDVAARIEPRACIQVVRLLSAFMPACAWRAKLHIGRMFCAGTDSDLQMHMLIAVCAAVR